MAIVMALVMEVIMTMEEVIPTIPNTKIIVEPLTLAISVKHAKHAKHVKLTSIANTVSSKHTNMIMPLGTFLIIQRIYHFSSCFLIIRVQNMFL